MASVDLQTLISRENSRETLHTSADPQTLPREKADAIARRSVFGKDAELELSGPMFEPSKMPQLTERKRSYTFHNPRPTELKSRNERVQDYQKRLDQANASKQESIKKQIEEENKKKADEARAARSKHREELDAISRKLDGQTDGNLVFKSSRTDHSRYFQPSFNYQHPRTPCPDWVSRLSYGRHLTQASEKQQRNELTPEQQKAVYRKKPNFEKMNQKLAQIYEQRGNPTSLANLSQEEISERSDEIQSRKLQGKIPGRWANQSMQDYYAKFGGEHSAYVPPRREDESQTNYLSRIEHTGWKGQSFDPTKIKSKSSSIYSSGSDIQDTPNDLTSEDAENREEIDRLRQEGWNLRQLEIDERNDRERQGSILDPTWAHLPIKQEEDHTGIQEWVKRVEADRAIRLKWDLAKQRRDQLDAEERMGTILERPQQKGSPTSNLANRTEQKDDTTQESYLSWKVAGAFVVAIVGVAITAAAYRYGLPENWASGIALDLDQFHKHD
jgi:hypothetical protein